MCSSNKGKKVAEGKDFEYNSCANIFQFMECENCKLLYLNPKPKQEEFKIIYPDEYYAYNFLKGKWSWFARIGKALIEKRYTTIYKRLIGNKGSILDIGCGDGRLLSLLQKAKGCEWDVYGLDFNTKGNTRSKEKGLNIYEGTLEEVDFKGKQFNLIIMNEVFEHVYDPNHALKKVQKIVKPQGSIVIETPCRGSWEERLFKKKYWGGYHFPRHFNIFSEKTIKRILEKNKFQGVKISFLLSPPFGILSIQNWLKDKK